MNCNVITAKTFEQAREKIKNLKKQNQEIGFVGSDDKLNRKILEKAPIDFLVILQKNRKDKQKQRNSGFKSTK